MERVTIVGGGLAGLIAAIHLAEEGVPVEVHEAGSRLGGRARTDGSLHRVNYGCHALYRHGDFARWLVAKDLLPRVHHPSLTGLRILADGRPRRMVAGLLRVMGSSKHEAPVDLSYRDWATRSFDAGFAKLAIGFASLPTYHPDPGSLSAAFVHERIARSSQWRPVWYIDGGWARLVEGLAARAEMLGAEILTRSRLDSLPSGPSIVATDLATASRLLDEPDLDWPSPDNALFDVALERRRGDPTAILDVDHHAYISNFAAGDPSIAPRGESLLQGVTGIRPGESTDAARQRIHALLDAGFRNWRERIVWQRTGRTNAAVGPADPPGASWRDRPAIDRGRGRWLVGDRVAAPGILAETCFESARIAAQGVLNKLT